MSASDHLASLDARLETGAEPEAWTVLAFLAGRDVPLDADELRGALRRALLLLAAGGDPHRELELDGRAVTALAADLDAPGPREELARGLARLRDDAANLPRALAALRRLLDDPQLAWRAFACALLAGELAGEE